MGGSLNLQNDYLLRGYSLSARKPVAILNLSYDHPTGVYVNGSVAGALDRENDPKLFGATANIGYAHRLGPDVSLDGGVTRSTYFKMHDINKDVSYTEYYLGLLTHNASAHVYYSPEYILTGVSTVYGEVEASIEPIEKLRLSAHLGLLHFISIPSPYPQLANQYDWRVAVTRPIGAFELHAAVSGGGPDPDFFNLRFHSKTAFVFGAGWSF